MTRGIYLGTLLICFSVCCSWASHGVSTWSLDKNPTAPLWYSQNSVEGSRPQDGFRQANEVKGSSTNKGAKHEPYPLDKYLISKTNPRRQSFYGTIGYVQPKKVGQSEGYERHSNQFNSVFRTLPGQQGTQRIGQYAPSKPDLNSPKRSSQPSSAWKPRERKIQQNPDLNPKINGKRGFKPPKEFMKPTSGLSRGSKRKYQKFSKHPFSYSQVNPVRSNIYNRYELPISHPLGLSQSHPVSAYNQAFKFGGVSSVVHHIPLEYGGHPIKRPGDEAPVKQSLTTEKPQKPLTSKPPKTYTFPPLQKQAYTLPLLRTEAYTTRRPKPHKKSKWIQVLSYKLSGVPVRTL